MSAKQLLRLAVVLGVVLLLWGAVALASRRSGESSRATVLPKIDTSAVDTISLQGPHDTTILARSKGGSWLADGHSADPQALADLLRALADSAGEAELVAQNPESYARLRVSDDSGRHVRVAAKKATLVQLVTGKTTTEGGGLYLRRAGAPEVYVVRGALASALGRSADEWRNHTIASVVPDSVAGIEIRRGNRSYSLRRKGKGWIFASGRSADSAAVAGLLGSYRSVKASGFETKAQQDSLRGSRPRRTARLSSGAGDTILTLRFDSLPSGLWVRVAGGAAAERSDEAYRLDSWVADQLTPADSTLRKR